MDNSKHYSFTSVQVPVEIWFHKELTAIDKILLTEIVNLVKANNNCFKSNQAFSELLGVSKDRVTRLLSSLKDRGFIEIKMEYKTGTKQIIRRTVSLSDSFRKIILGGLASENAKTPIVKNTDTLSAKTPIGIVENNYTPIGENTEDNIINKNKSFNKSINNIPLPPEVDNHNFTFDMFWNLYDKKVDRIKCERKWENLKAQDKKAIQNYLPGYVKSTPDIQFRKNPSTFLNNRAWENEIIQRSAVKSDKPRLLQPMEKREYGKL